MLTISLLPAVFLLHARIFVVINLGVNGKLLKGDNRTWCWSNIRCTMTDFLKMEKTLYDVDERIV